MAEGEIITSDQIIQTDIFQNTIESTDTLIEALNRCIAAFTKLMSASKGGLSGDAPKTVQEAQAYQTLTQRVNELGSANIKTKSAVKELTIAQAEAKIQVREANAGVMEAAKNNLGLTSEYQKQSQILNELRSRYRDLVLTGQAHLQSTKDLHREIAVLDGKLKTVDATVGVHTRNVGNYTHKILETSRATGGLTGLLGILGKAFGLDEEAVKSLEGAHHALTAGARDLHHALGLNNVAAGEGVKLSEAQIDAIETQTVATEAQTVATEEATVAQEASNAAWLASPVGIIVGLTVAVAAVGVAIYEMGKEADLTAYELEEFENAMSGFEKVLKITNDSMIKNAENKKAIDEAYGVGKGERGLKDEEEILKQKEKARQLEIRQTQIGLQYLQKISDEAYRVGNIKTQTRAAEEITKLKEKQAKLILEGNDFNHEKIIAEGKFQSELDKEKLKEATKSSEDFADTLRHLENENIRYSYDRKKAQIEENFSDESKKYAGHTEILLQLELKREKELQELWEEQQRAFDKIKADYKNQDIKKVQDDAKKETELNKDPEFSPKIKLKQDGIIAENKLDDKNRKEQIKQEEELADQIFKIVSDASNKRSELKLKEIEHQEEINQKSIDQQIALGVNGNAQVLAAELKKQDELEKAHQKELDAQKKRAEREEAIQLGLAFIKAFNADMDKGKSGQQALIDASEEVLAAKLIGKALAGSAYEGVEDTGNGGKMDNKGGSLWMLHPNERVIPKKLNDKLDGISNDELIDNALAFKNIYQPNFNDTLLQDFSRKQQVDNSMTHLLVEKMDKLIDVVDSKPVSHTNIDNAGRLVKTMIEKNNIRITTKQMYLNG